MKMLVLEPHVSGHHGPYLRWMAAGLTERGFNVIIVTLPESLEHPSLRALVDGAAGIRIIPFPGSLTSLQTRLRTLGSVAQEFAYWRLFRRWYKAHLDTVRPDVVFLPFLDYSLYATGLLGSPFGNCPWVGLAMLPSFHYQEMGVIAPRPALATIKKSLFFRLLNDPHLRCLLTIDEPLMAYLGAKPGGPGKIAFLPQPAEFGVLPDTVEAKQWLGLPAGRKLILVYGGITQRKGIVELLRALSHPDFPSSVDVLLAGSIASDIHHLLDESWVQSLSTQGRLIQIDRFIMTEEEPLLFAAADIVWLGYRRHYTESGALTLSACAGRPVLACEEGIIGWQTRRHGLGEVVNPKNPAAICKAVAVLLKRGPLQPSGATTQYPSRNTFSNACDTLATAMIEGVGGNVVGAPNEI